MEKFFMHRIQINNGVVDSAIEVHDTKNDAIRSFWGRMKTGYNNPQFPGMTYVAGKITDGNGAVVDDYDQTWLKEPAADNIFFMHHIRIDGATVSKDIDEYPTKDAAMVAFATEMEYGYDNPRFPNVELVSCEITDLLSGGMVVKAKTWAKPEPEPEPEPEE